RGPLGLREPEPQFGGERGQALRGAQLGVLDNEAVEVGEDPAPVAVPEGATAGQTEGLVADAVLLGDCVEPAAVGDGPGGTWRRRAAGAREDLTEELVEGGVHERS